MRVVINISESDIACCAEIVEWRQKGVVKQDGALAAVAQTLTHFDEIDRMQQAERLVMDRVTRAVAKVHDEKRGCSSGG